MSRLINIVWLFVLFAFSAVSSMAAEMSKSLVFKDDQVMMTQTSVLWERPVPRGIPQSCVTEAVKNGVAECILSEKEDRILTWFSFPLEVRHQTASVTFDRTTMIFSFSRGEVIETAPVWTLLLMILPMPLPFIVCFGLLASYRYSVSKMRGLYVEFLLRFGGMSVLIAVASLLSGYFLEDWQWIFLVVALFGATLFHAGISEVIGKWTSWLLDVAVGVTSLFAFVAIAASSHGAGPGGASAYEYFALMIGACAVAYALFEAILSYRRKQGLISA